MNALDSEFPLAKKLLYGWHMISNIAKMAKKIMKPGKEKELCTHLVNKMIFGDKRNVFDKNLELFKLLSSQKDFQSKEQLEDNDDDSTKVVEKRTLEKYFEDEWMPCKEKWAGYLTSQLKHFDCVTTQRVESGHNALKRKISALQSLNSSFEQICSYLLQFEGDYQDLELNEATITDARIYHEPRLCRLIHHVSRIGLITIRAELLEEVVPGELCNCRVKVVFGLPCLHDLPRDCMLLLSDIPERWILSSSLGERLKQLECDVSLQKIDVEKSAPWVKCITKLEQLFRQCEGNQQVQNLMAMVDELVDNAGEIIDHPNVVFPLASEVKAPGRPKHVKRKTALPKDFVRHKHRHLLVQKNKNDIRSILKEGLKEVMKEFLEEEPLKKIIKEIKKETQFAEKQEPLEEAKTTNFAKKQEPLEEAEKYSSGIKRPKHLQDDYWYDLPSPKKQNKNVHDFALPAQIDQAAISLTFNLKSDGWCGFRVFAHLKEGGEDQFPLVKKKMLATMATHGKLYEHNFGMDVAKVTEVIAFGSKIDPALGENISSCPSSMWFSAPDCAQIIADTYNEPVCVYSDDQSVLPVTFLPLHDWKPLKRKPLLMVLHHVHGCHWTTIKVKPHVHRSWSEVNVLYFDAIRRGSIIDCFSTSWNHWGQFPKNKSYLLLSTTTTTTITTTATNSPTNSPVNSSDIIDLTHI
ncbi:hypothetical protein PHYBLDRAFT_153402 [Phycomyces blakesleeanus NRRL 1555(-)]|uniref:OTU domain-containing protein n=1 Tax=Phycomyces blakesleeanus (strain ATCC 8743b / DSM 1359 / FGSC 10004 / NBRC 33097 / NRRL 1555) TaxID=763407 RepID=A0A162TAF7_PHYB8|nr:hypothetical protein PHYBLDRAFT_153402 [Phycomyces blakesleeanus NRRL 1555(-)]OAD65503.1 hypothetical protein PHYBLDRAFT_153402 [Phycomyces blakesleeanus NRRL 1555(-)]|eukprot:XP_018283543.1 hypothetical protein PHYBLDRAFT_153402 [Phycomyces blakesleeanus NRRL 1555(-)]